MFSSELTCIDGQTYAGHRDPPGQASVYIPPGDDRKETYRHYTFRQFPTNCPVRPENFAKAGFYYTGFRDRVKCFSCGLCVENWIVGDVPSNHGWHKSDCDFAHGRDTANRPIPSFMRFLKTSSSTPSVGEGAPPTAEQTRESLYPCNQPLNPHFSSVITRLESFNQRNGVTWPKGRLRVGICLLYTSPSPRDRQRSRMPSSA